MEADAHLGLANRLAAPFARRVFLAFPIAGRDGPKYRVTGGRSRRARGRCRATRRGARLGLPEEGPVLLVSGGSLGARALNELAVESFGAAARPCSTSAARREVEPLARARVADRLPRCSPSLDDFGAALAAADLVLARAGGSVWELAAAGKPAMLVPVPARDRRPPDEERRVLPAAGGAVVVPETRARPRAGARALAARRPARGSRRWARRCCGARARTRRSEIAEELIALAGAARRVGGSGSSGSAAPGMSALRARRAGVGRRGRRLGPRADAVPRAARAPRDRRSTIAPEPAARRTAAEVVVSSRATPRSRARAARRAARRARLAAPVDRRRRRAREDDDDGDDRVLPRPARARPGVPDRRRDPAARRQRARGRGLARRRGRRVGPLARAAAPARSPSLTNVDLDHHATFASRARCASCSSAGSRAAPQVVRGDELEPVALRARACRASTTA